MLPFVVVALSFSLGPAPIQQCHLRARPCVATLGGGLPDSSMIASSDLELPMSLLAEKDIGPIAGPIVALLALAIPFTLMNVVVVPSMQALSKADKGESD